METWRGAAEAGQGPRWAILLLAVDQLANGSWRYTYSIAPGRTVAYTTWPGPDMVSPYDPAIITDAGRIAGRL